MDTIFVEGVAAVVSAVIVFCGSVWLLLTMVLGARLAYFITASVTLAFVVMMGLVWSLNPLGPVGALPGWEEISVTEDQAGLEGPSAGSYPDSPWQSFDEENEDEQALASELESAATDSAGAGIDAGDIEAFTDPAQVIVSEGSARYLESEGVRYGAVQLEPAPAPEEEEEEEGPEEPIQQLEVPPVPSPSPTPASELPDENARVFVLFELDPGNPLGTARTITAGGFLLLVAHLFGLGRSERRSRALSEDVNGTTKA
ncbi:MAG: hypothetical protein ACRDJ2_00205 [Actinomycetota bacterium]